MTAKFHTTQKLQLNIKYSKTEVCITIHFITNQYHVNNLYQKKMKEANLAPMLLEKLNFGV